jgi:murein DD-endopeptidase MepM/ murein hydrolase activator NlpD
MTYPIPDVGVSTPYGKRGSHWSCQEDSNGNGIHTGVDFACGNGTRIYAPIAGEIRHRSYGSAFGSHQFAISPDPGQPFADGEVFFAHTRTRLKSGTRVEIGDFIAEVGSEGNVTGPHLHMEYMPNTKNTWRCGIHADPKPVLDHEGASTMAQDVYNYEYSGKSEDTKEIPLGAYTWVTKDTDDPAASGLEFKLVYLNVKLRWARKGVANIRVKFVREGDDPTAYQDHRVASMEDADGNLITPDEFLLTNTHFEAGEKGIGGKWYVKITGAALASAAVDTRYNKYATIKDKG